MSSHHHWYTWNLQWSKSEVNPANLKVFINVNTTFFKQTNKKYFMFTEGTGSGSEALGDFCGPPSEDPLQDCVLNCTCPCDVQISSAEHQ